MTKDEFVEAWERARVENGDHPNHLAALIYDVVGALIDARLSESGDAKPSDPPRTQKAPKPPRGADTGKTDD